MDKILEGELSRFEVPDLLTFLNVGKQTGVLLLERPQQETKLFFRKGDPVYASSTRDALRLGSLLVRLGKVSQIQLDRVLAKLGSGYRIGQVLLQDELLTEDELASVLKVQISEVVFETFDWSSGLFAFFDGVPPPSTAVILEMDLHNLIMEGVRRIDERGRLAEFFPDLGMVVESIVNPERVKASVTLTPDEWQVYFLVDGRRSLAEICRLAGNPDELATLQVLHHLAVAKFLQVVPAAIEATPPQEEEPAGTRISHAQDPPASRSQVEFSTGPPARKIDDDTKDVVTPKAIQYLKASNTITVSRLVLLKDGTETSFPLTRDTYTLGRHRNNDIVVSDPKVSSFHARLDRGADGFTFVDLKSRNGSFVNGRRSTTALLKTGDELRLGTAKLVYRIDYTSGASV
jgi:Domain of unknown function (DUF4388)/FHA domain